MREYQGVPKRCENDALRLRCLHAAIMPLRLAHLTCFNAIKADSDLIRSDENEQRVFTRR